MIGCNCDSPSYNLKCVWLHAIEAEAVLDHER